MPIFHIKINIFYVNYYNEFLIFFQLANMIIPWVNKRTILGQRQNNNPKIAFDFHRKMSLAIIIKNLTKNVY